MAKSTKWIDLIAIVISVIVIGFSLLWLIQNGTFSLDLVRDEKLSWHLVRSSGLVAYLLLLASTVWGLFISSQFVKDWSPGTISLTVHSTLSWLALLLSLTHALLLMFDDYFSYTLSDIFIPFTGPYRPEVVGLGTLAFWIIVIVSLSFPVKKLLGHRNWKFLHYFSYAAFGLVSVHSILAGTDGHLLGFRILVGTGILLVVSLLGLRISKQKHQASTRPIKQKVQKA